MSLWKIAWRSIQQRALASGLTAFSMGLAVALVVCVLVIHGVVAKSFNRGSQGYDLIIGAKGGELPLVLNSVFHLGKPGENIPYSYYQEFLNGRYAEAVELAIPVCMGHAYKDCAAVATIPEFFDELRYHGNQKYKFAEGRNFDTDNFYEAVAGSWAAKHAELKIGDTFAPVATLAGHEGHEGHSDFKVVGILEPTGTPNDRAIFMNIEGFFLCPAHMAGPSSSEKFLRAPNVQEPTDMEATVSADADAGAHAHDAADGHDHEAETNPPPVTIAQPEALPPEITPPEPQANHDAHDHSDHDAHDAHDAHDHSAHDHSAEAGHEHTHREVTAILVCTDPSRQQLAMALPRVINEGSVAQAVMPARVITQLFKGVVGNVQMLLLIVAILVVIEAGIGILVSIYNSMNDRRHEIAIMRALGAGRQTVMAIILLESILLSLGGGILGVLIGHSVIGAIGPSIAEQTGVIVSAFDFQLHELILIPGLVILAALVGYLPAVSAYKTDVAKSLAASP